MLSSDYFHYFCLTFKKSLSITVIHSNEAHTIMLFVCAVKEMGISDIQKNKITW